MNKEEDYEDYDSLEEDNYEDCDEDEYDDEYDDEYYVAEILKKRIKKGVEEYLVLWEPIAADEDEDEDEESSSDLGYTNWESRESLLEIENTAILIKKFEKKTAQEKADRMKELEAIQQEAQESRRIDKLYDTTYNPSTYWKSVIGPRYSKTSSSSKSAEFWEKRKNKHFKKIPQPAIPVAPAAPPEPPKPILLVDELISTVGKLNSMYDEDANLINETRLAFERKKNKSQAEEQQAIQPIKKSSKDGRVPSLSYLASVFVAHNLLLYDPESVQTYLPVQFRARLFLLMLKRDLVTPQDAAEIIDTLVDKDQRTLNFSVLYPSINDSALPVVAKCTSLTTLDIANCRNVTDKSFKLIAENCPNVTYLNLPRMYVNLFHYVNAEDRFPNLKTIIMRSCHVPNLMSVIKAMTKLRHLEHLDLNGCFRQFNTDASVIVPIVCKKLKFLDIIHLIYTNAEQHALEELFQYNEFPELEDLRLTPVEDLNLANAKVFFFTYFTFVGRVYF